jgi:uncharacterized protein YdbL (DUF1318 family)
MAGALAMVALPAWALSLDEAKTRGLVGETVSGYIAPVSGASGDVQTLVAEVNAKRRLEYSRIAEKNKQPVDVVAKLMAEKLFQRTAPGEYVQDASGTWKKK